MKYKHAEAFCLMVYSCVDCGHTETIWNSRDGVTPFGTFCPSCDRPSLMHDVQRFRPQPQPDYQLNHGQKFWRNMDASEAVDILNRQVRHIKEQGHPITDMQISNLKKSKLEEVKGGVPYLAICIKPI